MIAIGCDHGAVELKNQMIEHLKKRGIECKDVGTYTSESCDYPVYANKVTDLVTSGECELGILMCGTGIGMSMAANKVKGIRAALCSDCFSAQATREHNNANIIALSGKIPLEKAKKMIKIFINSTPNQETKYQRRINQILEYENAN